MSTGLKFFIPVIYFDVRKKCNDRQVQLDGVPGALTARGNQHVNCPTLRAHGGAMAWLMSVLGSQKEGAQTVPSPLPAMNAYPGGRS